MGLSFEEGEFKISLYGKSSEAQIRLCDAVGLALQKDGSYAMVGDFYHANNSILKKYYAKETQFFKDIQTAYAIEEATEALENEGYNCVENIAGTVGKNGLVRMVFENF